MTNDETKAVLAVIKTAFPGFCKDIDPGDVLTLWHDMFRDDDGKIVAEAVKSLISTLRFPPTVADVKERIRLLTQPPFMTGQEAWSVVDKAISHYDAEKNFRTLPPLLQRLVVSPNRLREWAGMDESDVVTVVCSNFLRSYESAVRRERELSALPESSKAMISDFDVALNLTTGGEK
jgi:hypothetical protein